MNILRNAIVAIILVGAFHARPASAHDCGSPADCEDVVTNTGWLSGLLAGVLAWVAAKPPKRKTEPDDDTPSVTIGSDSNVICPNQDVAFTATASPEGGAYLWSCNGTPGTGSAQVLQTHFATGPERTETVTVVYTTPNGREASASYAISVRRLSGAEWHNLYPDHTQVNELAAPFQGNVQAFIAALQTGGAHVAIGSCLRPDERAFLMHYSYRVGHGQVAPEAVPSHPNIPICWVHRDDDGTPNAQDSIAAALALANSYGIAFPPAYPSRHSLGRAIDMTITWNGQIQVATNNGTPPVVLGPPGNNSNPALHALGATYGVIKLIVDPPHWSDDGH